MGVAVPKPFKWTLPAFAALRVLATCIDLTEGKELAAEVAEVSTRTIERWQKHPEFAEQVTAIRGELAQRVLDEAKETSLILRANRIAVIDEEEEAFQTIIQARKDVAEEDVAGSETGRLRKIVRRKVLAGDLVEESETHVLDGELISLRRENVKIAEVIAKGLEDESKGKDNGVVFRID